MPKRRIRGFVKSPPSLPMKFALPLLLSTAFGCLRAAPGIQFPDLPCGELHGEATLFGFDSAAFPFQRGLETRLIAGRPSDVVLPPGPPGSADEFVRYYGTVLRIDGQFRMWYWGAFGPEPGTIGFGHGLHPGKALCYATSTDGLTWVKPNLGLVEFHGSKANNRVDFPAPSARPAAPILYDSADPDPARRFKLVYEADFGQSEPQFGVAWSPDGLHWTLSRLNPVGPFLEMAGIARFKDRYYVSGQDWSWGHQPFKARKLATFVSTDFEHWSPCAAVGLSRSPDLTGPSAESDHNNIEEVHLGAALWNRGNVLLGIYGQWHGDPTGDRRQITLDLGLTVSHDALHHEEPVPGFKFVASHEQPGSAPFDKPAVMQGQGMANAGEHTYYWYSMWKGDLATGVRVATWARDRLGSLKPSFPAPRPTAAAYSGAQAISCAFRAAEGSADAYVNASGLGPRSKLKLTLLDEGFQPIAGYTAEIGANGFRQPVAWRNGARILPSLGEVHIQVRFEGIRPEDATLHALYLVPVSS